jgi:ketosteroid isomerase-like protein
MSDRATEALQAVGDEEFRLMETGDVDAFLALLSSDVLFLPPNDSPKAREAVAPWIRRFIDGFSVKFLEHSHDETLLLGDWALLRTSFRWRVTPRAGGEALVRLGTTLRVFRREPAAPWRLAREIWNTYPAPEA